MTTTTRKKVRINDTTKALLLGHSCDTCLFRSPVLERCEHNSSHLLPEKNTCYVHYIYSRETERWMRHRR